MLNGIYTAAAMDTDPETAVLTATMKLVNAASNDYGERGYTVVSLDHSSLLYTSDRTVDPKFLGRLLGGKSYVATDEYVMVTATLVVLPV